MRVPIPDDWDEEQDGYCIMLACIPNSVLWRAVFEGLFYATTWWKYWDRDTGDIYAVREITREVFKGLCMATCNDLIIELQALVTVLGEIRDKIPEGQDSTNTMRAIASAVAKIDASTVVNINSGCGCGDDDCDCETTSTTVYSGGGGEKPLETVDVI